MISRLLHGIPPGWLRRQLKSWRRFLPAGLLAAPGSIKASTPRSGPVIDYLAERQVPGFSLVESVGRGSGDGAQSTCAPPLVGPVVIRVEGVDPHEIKLTPKPFDIGLATIPNAWMWALPTAEDLRNATHSGRWFRYDGAHTIVSLDGYTYSDCLFRNHGVPREIGIERDRRLHMPFGPPPQTQRLQGEHVFLGDVHNHFGHVLVESVNRLWCLGRMTAAERARRKFVFFNTWGSLRDSLLVPLLALYDIDISNVLVIDRHTIFDELIVPSPAQRPFNGHDIYYSQTMEELYGELRDRYLVRHKPSAPRTFEKIFLSRGRFVAARHGQRQLDEAAMVEQHFSDAGFEIIHPEKLAFEDQLLLASSAREIAGPAGSAHHIAAFASKLERQTILTHPQFFMATADASLTMMKGAEVTYYFGASKDRDCNQLEADWTIVPEVFNDWFGKRYAHA